MKIKCNIIIYYSFYESFENKMKILFLLLNRDINLANIRHYYSYKLISFPKIYKLNLSPI